MNPLRTKLVNIILPTSILIGLYFTSLYSYVLFHTLAEFFSILIAGTIFILAWNFRRFYTGGFLIFIGSAYLFIGLIDLLHTLTYKGTGFFPQHDANTPTQLWIAGRFLQSFSLLLAPIFLKRKVRLEWVVSGFFLATTLIFLSIFIWQIFPDCFIEGSGLTPFKIISEYVIIALLASSIILLSRNWLLINQRVLRFMILSISFTMIGELAFTFYIDVYGFSNLVGHYFKIFAFFFIYLAIIEPVASSIYADMTQLRQTQVALRASEERAQQTLGELRAIYAHSPIGLCFFDADLRYQAINDTLAKINHLAVDDHIGKTIHEVFPKEIAADINRVCEQVLSTGIPIMEHEISGKVDNNSNLNGSWLVNYHPVINENGEVVGISCAVQDITERKRVIDALQKSEERFRSLAEYTSDWELWIDENGNILYTSPSSERITGRSAQEFMDHPELLFEIVHPEDINVVREHHSQLRNSIETCTLDYRIITPDGQVRWIEHNCRPVITPENIHRGRRISNRDNTERILEDEVAHKTKARLEVNQRLIEQREKERLQIARDLHDGPIQNLYALSFDLSSIAEETKEQHIEEMVQTAIDAVHSLVYELRAFMTELRPPVLVNFGLAKAMHSHSLVFTEKNPKITINLGLDNVGMELKETTQMGLYRIYQESLNNILRHAEADQITVNLTRENGEILLEVIDNGCGFDLPDQWIDLAREGHLGLVGMMERAEAVGGKVEVLSAIGKGTKVKVRVPSNI